MILYGAPFGLPLSFHIDERPCAFGKELERRLEVPLMFFDSSLHKCLEVRNLLDMSIICMKIKTSKNALVHDWTWLYDMYCSFHTCLEWHNEV